MKSDALEMNTTDIQVESSYVEDGVLNVLVSRRVTENEKPSDPEFRWTLLADPKTRELKRVDFCIAKDEGFEYPAYSPTVEQMALFNDIVRNVNEN